MIYRENVPNIEVMSGNLPWSFDADGAQMKLASEAYRISLAHLFDPYLAVHTSSIEPLPHQISADYLKRGGTYGNKLKVPNFPVSEAAFLIWSLDQREDWATIICLVGGGQEINTGEAGISE